MVSRVVCGASSMAGCCLPINPLGVCIALKGRRYGVFREFHFALAHSNIVLSDPSLGVHASVYAVWFVGGDQLVFSETATVFKQSLEAGLLHR